jgi:adenine phosphoribosyltransferase
MSVRFSKTRGRNPYRLTVTTQLSERARNAYLKRFSWVDGHADTWAALRDADTLALVIDALAACVKESRATAVLGIEARGFLLCPAVAKAAGLGFVAARKGDGLFAGATHQTLSAPGYRGIQHRIRVRRDDLHSGDVIVLVDDWIETGSQASAARQLAEQAGASWAGCVVVIDESSEETLQAVGPIRSLVPGSLLPQE